MNSLISRPASRTASRAVMQKRWSHGDDMPYEEAINTAYCTALFFEQSLKDIHVWKRATYAGLAFLAVFYTKLVFFTPHHEVPERKPYSHLSIRRKLFPWGDGTEGLFATLFGKPHTHHSEHH